MRLEEVRARIRTASELHGIVSTLRVLSETRLLQAQRAFGNFLRYADEVERAVGRGLSLVGAEPADEGRPEHSGSALVVLGAEHGFVGSLDEKIVQAARERLEREPGTAVFLAGSRLARAAREQGMASEARLRLATTVSGFERTARALTDLVASRLARGELGRVVVLGPRRSGPTEWTLASDVVFPVPGARERSRGRAPPYHYLEARVLVVKLIEEFIFSRLAGAVAEAFLCEQIARVRAMEATRRSLEDKLEDLRRSERVVRQEVITSELLEVTAGAGALEEARAG